MFSDNSPPLVALRGCGLGTFKGYSAHGKTPLRRPHILRMTTCPGALSTHLSHPEAAGQSLLFPPSLRCCWRGSPPHANKWMIADSALHQADSANGAKQGVKSVSICVCL